MTPDALHHQLAELESAARARLADAQSPDAVRGLETQLVKEPIANAIKSLKSLPPDQRGPAGQAINAAKERLSKLFAAALDSLRQKAVSADHAAAAAFDPTLPAPPAPRGALHPVTIVQWEVERILASLGFAVVAGPEMETDFYNFEALNIPATPPPPHQIDNNRRHNPRLAPAHPHLPARSAPCSNTAPPSASAPPAAASATKPSTPPTKTPSSRSKAS
ncbi:MAG: hypothetical protein U1A27_05900 [Phycisphaerae bacterium]